MLPEVESTNNYATARAHEGLARHGHAVFTTVQTAGRGQRGRAWLSEPGANLALSTVLQPPGHPAAAGFSLSCALALGTYRFVKSIAGEETSIKWPNDLYWRDRKAGGILLENALQGDRWKFAVAGIGLNLNQTSFAPDYGRAVSLRQITGRSFDPEAAARTLCTFLQEAYAEWAADAAAVLAAYNAVLFRRGEAVRLRCPGRVFEGLLLGVGPQGHLRVQTAVEETFSVGEVEWIFTS